MDVHSYTTAIRLWLSPSVFTQGMNDATMMAGSTMPASTFLSCPERIKFSFAEGDTRRTSRALGQSAHEPHRLFRLDDDGMTADA